MRTHVNFILACCFHTSLFSILPCLTHESPIQTDLFEEGLLIKPLENGLVLSHLQFDIFSETANQKTEDDGNNINIFT